MLRPLLASVGVTLLCCTTVSGQVQLQTRRVLGPIKNAGVFHVGTGTWTRGSGSMASLGPDVIFRSDVSSGYWGSGWENIEAVDDGILPGPGNPNKTGNPGPQTSYLIDGMEFAYCSLSTSPVRWDFTFYDSYVSCAFPGALSSCTNKAGTLPTLWLPAGGFCWTATFDLSLGGYEICMQADGGICAPGYDGGGLGLDHFGWGSTYDTVDGGITGPLLRGHDPGWFPEGEGTVYQPAFTSACSVPAASALGGTEFFIVNPTTLPAGCWSFGTPLNNTCSGFANVPPGQFHLLLYTDSSSACGPTPCTTIFCDTDPDNLGDAALSGCDCSTGSIVLSLSTNGQFAGQFAYPMIGLGTGVVKLSGVSELCIAGSAIGRYTADVQAIFNSSAAVDLLNANSAPGGGVPSIGGSLCNGNTWRFQWWLRDGMNPSRFSKGVSALIF